jgi:homocysteine S-methyltransferase
MKTLEELDLSGLRVLDGALATELERRGCDLSGPLWSAHVLESSPETIAAVHREYLEAGSDCLFTASYQISEEGFRELGRGPEDAAAALRASVAIAGDAEREYRAATGRKLWIAASLGPYGAVLHNGAEYHGNYDLSFDDLVRFHSRRIAVLKETPADFLIFETIPSLEEARAIAAALRAHPGTPAAVSFTCRDEQHVAHGERLAACAQALAGEAQVIAVGVNCTAPGLLLGLIGELKQATGKPILVSPNSGERWDADRRAWAGQGEIPDFGTLAKLWRQAGAEWIGGCCRTGPDEIRAVAQALEPVMTRGRQRIPHATMD